MASGRLDGRGDVVVRRLRSDEAELLQELRLAALSEAPDAFGETLEEARSADWQARALDGSSFVDRAVFVATVGARSVGMVFVKCGVPPEPAFLGAMWVRPDVRRRGAGHSLLRQGLDFLRRTGQTEVVLWVTRGNDGVVAFYQAAGFRETGATATVRPGSKLLNDQLRCSLE